MAECFDAACGHHVDGDDDGTERRVIAVKHAVLVLRMAASSIKLVSSVSSPFFAFSRFSCR